MFRDIVKEHGQSDAESLRDDKKAKQERLGDFRAHEMFLCFNGASLETMNETKVRTEENVRMDMDSSLTRELRAGMQPFKVDPTGCGRALQPSPSAESLGELLPGGKGGKGKGKKKGTDKDKKKLPNYAGKAHGKVKIGRTTLTDAKSEALAQGYISQINLYKDPLEKATEALDWKLVEGTKDEASLAPLVTSLEAAVESYASAVRPIKGLLVS
ncbi:F5 [Symbiodinium sp. CCMP2592]|nr:F5 [Symbiodinium sp. CCMP2592]